MATRLSKATLHKGILEIDPSGSSTTGASIAADVDQELRQNPKQPAALLRLYVRLPTHKTVTMDISRNCQSTAELKRQICDEMDMPDTESIVLSHQGRSLATNFDENLQESVSKYHLSTIQISVALPGGAQANGILGDDVSTPDRAQSSLKQFMRYISNCLTLTDAEIKTLANSLNYQQIDKLENFVNNKLDEVQILKILSDSSDHQIRVALKDLRCALATDKTDPEMLDDIDQKIQRHVIQMNKENPMDQQIGRALATYNTQCQTNLFRSFSEKQWCWVFVDEILQSSQFTVLFQMLQSRKHSFQDNADQIRDTDRGYSKTQGQTERTMQTSRTMQTIPRAKKFWQNLLTEQHFMIWASISESLQKEMLLSPEQQLIDSHQQARLWERMIFVKKSDEFWKRLSDDEKTQALTMMDSKLQLSLWNQISKQDQIWFFNYLEDKNQKNQLWSSMSHKLQDQALDLLSHDQVVELLGSLDQQTLCLTMSMFKDKVLEGGQNFTDLLTNDDQKLAVATFNKFGKSSTTDRSSEKFIEDLVDQQYEGYKCTRNLQQDYIYEQVIENPLIENGLITLGSFNNCIQYYDSKWDRYGKQRSQEGLTAGYKDEGKSSSQQDDRPRILHPTLVREEGKDYKEWRMDQVNADPVLNEANISEIASYELIDGESGYWCAESFTISNRISKLYKGSDGHVFIFSRVSDEDSNKEAAAAEGTNNIQLHVFRLLINVFKEELDMKLVQKYDQAVEQMFGKIETQLLDEFRQEVTNEYNHMRNNATDQQLLESANTCKFDLQNQQLRYSEWMQDVQNILGDSGYYPIGNTGNSLEEDEFRTFFKKYQGWTQRYSGGYIDDSRDVCSKFYHLYQRLTPEINGVIKKDCSRAFLQVWFPLWCELLIKDHSENSSHKIYNIQQESHLGQELLKKDQEKKSEGELYMDQAPNLIQNDGNLLLVYTSATEAEGPGLYFYDLKSSQTCAKVSKAELFLDCYPHQTDAGVTNIRYIIGDKVAERSIDFKQTYGQSVNSQQIFDVAQDDLNLIQSSNHFTRKSSTQDNWEGRYISWGLNMEVFVHVNRKEDKENFRKSFQLIFKHRPDKIIHSSARLNWAACYQSYEENGVTFKQAKIVEGAEFISKQSNKTFVIAQNLECIATQKQVRLVEALTSEKDLRTKDSEFDDGGSYKQNQKRVSLHFQKRNKFEIPIIQKDGCLMGLYFSKDNELSYFFHSQQSQENVQLQQIIQQKKLWSRTIVSYPFLFYTGLSPECREIVVANLADTTQPQKIIQLPDGMQLQFLIKSNLDDRIYFQAFVPNTGTRGDFEIIHRFPFKKNENLDNHEISIRCLKVNSCDAYAVASTKATHFNIICDSHSINSKLMYTYQDDNTLIVRHKKNMLAMGNKITLPVVRSSKNNFYWVEESLALGFTLRGLTKISKKDNKPQSQLLRDFNLIDSTYISIVVENKLIDGEESELISLLDKDLHLYTYIVNEGNKSFERFNEVPNLGQNLHIDPEWLIFNQKAQLTFEMYKLDYKLFSSETVGVIFKDFIVFYSISNNVFSMVDTANAKFPLQLDTNGGVKKIQVKQTWNIDGTDFRYMLCKVKNTSQSYFVTYPAPESRQLDLFGFQGRINNIQTTFISENLVLAQFLYKDIHQTWESEGQMQTEENYWSVINQTGQIQSLPLKLESDSSIVYSKETESGQVVIFNHKTINQIVKFNLKGEVVFEQTQDDENILQRTINMIKANKKLSLKAPEQDQEDHGSSNNELSFSKVFLGPSQGRLYRLASINMFDGSKDQLSEQNESFSLFGSIEIPIDNTTKTEGLDKITVLIMMCKSEAQYQHFQESVFQICKDDLCIFSPQAIKKQIRIISLAGKDTVKEEPNSLMMKDRKQNNVVEKEQSTEQQSTIGQKGQSIETVKQKLQREETLRIQKIIEKRQFNLTTSSVYPTPFTKEDLEGLPTFIWTDYTEKTSIFKKKSKERVIDIEKLSDHSLEGELTVQLDVLQSTTQNISLKLTGDTDDESQVTQDGDYLQISLPQKVFLYDLSYDDPKENYSCFEIQHFVDSQKFVDLGLPRIWARTDESIWRQLRTSHQRNVFLANDINGVGQSREEKFVSLIKSFSFSDVQGLSWLSERLEQKSDIQTTSFESLMVSYRGHNFYSMFSDNKAKLKKILEFIQDELYQREEAADEDEDFTNNSLIRRFYRILSMPTPNFAKSDQSTKNSSSEFKGSLEISQQTGDDNHAEPTVEEVRKSLGTRIVSFFKREEKLVDTKINFDTQDLAKRFTTALQNCKEFDVNLRDLFMQLANNSDEFKLSDFAANQEEMKKILESYSTTLNQFLTGQLTQTPITKSVAELNWPVEQWKTPLIFKQCSQGISKDSVQAEVNRKFKGQRDWKISQVQVKQLQTNWLVQNNGTFPKFSSVVQSCSSDRIFETEFMKDLVLGYWDRNSSIIKWYCFLPWVLYLILTNVLFTMILEKNYEETMADNSSKTAQYVLSALTLLLLLQQVYIEWLQLDSFSGQGLRDYFSNITNTLDIIQLSTTAWIIISNLTEGGSQHTEQQRMVASITICILWAKSYDWLRLFDEPAFFVRLLSRTLYDIKDFTILFLVALAMFGSSTYMLQYNLEKGDLVESVTNVFMIDLVINQYMLSLGEFNTLVNVPEFDTKFMNHLQWYLVWFIQLAATFFTSVTMLNMLIAIMGNTFGEVIEKKAKEAMDTKLEIMSDFINIIAFFEKDTKNFLFIVKTVIDDEEEEGGESGEGAFNSLKKGMFSKIEKLEQNQTKTKNQQMSQAGKFKDQIQQNIEKAREESKKVSQATKEAIEAKMDSMVSKNETMETRMEAMEEKMVRMEQSMDLKMDLILQEIKQNAFNKDLILDVIQPIKKTTKI